ncbi:protein phosphatase 2C domain-containing protein [Cardiosporidium cionae]|uniref:Protein phosphatase 2C domain-containing protein n=1 Tax=Cardiosporidium cionae TaxID=476202 RepID=A0ABQ7J783_9APIC|nr:protein phosphatase 2C domain-containing protein [Cardiosporidium cionae]|eukprot:KAF8819852.1 protein phosphatase 2C domain-containing protein [Cardiosporidium cionae]
MVSVSFDELAEALTSPPKWETDITGEWLVAPSGEWLYNPLSKLAYHAVTDSLFAPASNDSNEDWIAIDVTTGITDSVSSSADIDDATAMSQPLKRLRSDIASETKGESDRIIHTAAASLLPDDFDAETDSDGNDDLQLDLETDLLSGTASLKSNAPNKSECEDRFITRIALPLNLISSTDALCYYFAIFDGHSGVGCADYAQQHLHNNIMSTYRQSIERMQRIQNSKRRRKGQRMQSVEMETLIHSCIKGFKITDSNYLDIAKRKSIYDGCTACACLLYGPDIDGALKLLCAHAGDSRAILCRSNIAMRLTEDHKPNRADEKKRIEAAGGMVIHTSLLIFILEYSLLAAIPERFLHIMKVEGIWRLMMHSKELQTSLGLSVSRALGDVLLKYPKKILSAEAEINIYTIDFDNDYFLVLGSDGVFDVLTDQEIVDLVLNNERKNPEQVATLVVQEAEKRGSTDDKTCTVVYFGWHDRFKKCQTAETVAKESTLVASSSIPPAALSLEKTEDDTLALHPSARDESIPSPTTLSEINQERNQNCDFMPDSVILSTSAHLFNTAKSPAENTGEDTEELDIFDITS